MMWSMASRISTSVRPLFNAPRTWPASSFVWPKAAQMLLNLRSRSPSFSEQHGSPDDDETAVFELQPIPAPDAIPCIAGDIFLGRPRELGDTAREGLVHVGVSHDLAALTVIRQLPSNTTGAEH